MINILDKSKLYNIIIMLIIVLITTTSRKYIKHMYFIAHPVFINRLDTDIEINSDTSINFNNRIVFKNLTTKFNDNTSIFTFVIKIDGDKYIDDLSVYNYSNNKNINLLNNSSNSINTYELIKNNDSYCLKVFLSSEDAKKYTKLNIKYRLNNCFEIYNNVGVLNIKPLDMFKDNYEMKNQKLKINIIYKNFEKTDNIQLLYDGRIVGKTKRKSDNKSQIIIYSTLKHNWYVIGTLNNYLNMKVIIPRNYLILTDEKLKFKKNINFDTTNLIERHNNNLYKNKKEHLRYLIEFNTEIVIPFILLSCSILIYFILLIYERRIS